MPFRLGPYEILGRVFLAPMAGYTDAPFRETAKACGAAYAVGEMMTADSALWETRKSEARLRFMPDEHPKTVQLLGADPKALFEAVTLAAQKGVDVIDLNMGCPVKKVCVKGAGAALMKDPERAIAVLDAVGQAAKGSSVVATLKMRLGYDEIAPEALKIALAAQKAGFAMIVIHARTRKQGMSGPANWVAVAPISKALAIPVVINGGIDSPEAAAYALEASKASALMVGEAALGAPWVLREIDAFLETGKRVETSLSAKKEALAAHWNAHDAFYEESSERLFKKHLKYYEKRVPGLAPLLGDNFYASRSDAFRDKLSAALEALN